MKKRISRSPRRSRISPVLVPPPSRQVSGSSCMQRAEISEFVHIVVIGIPTFPCIPWNFDADMSYRFLIKQFFRRVNFYGAPCNCENYSSYERVFGPRPAGLSPTPALCWGRSLVAPPTISVTNRRGGKLNVKWRALDEIFQMKLKNLTPGSQVRSNIKCLTFPFNAFPPQNA